VSEGQKKPKGGRKQIAIMLNDKESKELDNLCSVLGRKGKRLSKGDTLSLLMTYFSKTAGRITPIQPGISIGDLFFEHNQCGWSLTFETKEEHRDYLVKYERD